MPSHHTPARVNPPYPATRAITLVALLLTLVWVVCSVQPQAHASDTDTDYGTWSEVAQAVSDELNSALEDYRQGDRAGAAAGFQRAYNSDYVASNLAKVTSDRLGEETMAEQRDAFSALRSSAYAAGNEQTIADGVADLATSVANSATELDALTDLSSPRDYAAERAATIATERAQLQASQTQVNEGRGERTWSDIAAEMTTLINQGYDKAVAGDGEAGAALVNQAYYGYYEKLGFEKTVMAAISGDRVSQVENQFKVVRKAMLSGADPSELKADVDSLTTMLADDAATLDGGAAADVNPIKVFLSGSFGQALLILLREGLEAILVVAAIIAYLIKAGMKNRVKQIYIGIVLGLIASGIVAVLFAWLYNSASAHQEVLEGVVALVAMVMLLFTSNWMLSKASVASWNAYIKDKTEASISNGGVWALTSLSFLAVFREGAETVMFYEALFAMDPGGSASIWQGFGVGALVLVIVFLLIRFTSVKIPLRPFFAITSAMMAVLVVIFAGGGVHALLEGDIVPATYIEGVPTYDYLGIYPYRETLGAQAVMAVIVIVLSVVSLVRHRSADKERARAAAAEEPGVPAEAKETKETTTAGAQASVEAARPEAERAAEPAD
ncbi:FTR1 family iron permease [Actinomyces oricola]|uniref:FTR1 family iron permease n=1 Tax=Actinomyces oricola TaxID=206043 RepID=UPI000FFF67AA|nr:FTR1 family protein [Actinomyces oricola]